MVRIRCAASARTPSARAIRWAIPTAATPRCPGRSKPSCQLPEKFASTARLSLFFDFGQAFFTGDEKFTDKNGSRVTYGFDLNELRTSAGIGVQWLAPLGLFRFSFAYPLRYRQGTWRTYGDDVERFQFSIGNAF